MQDASAFTHIELPITDVSMATVDGLEEFFDAEVISEGGLSFAEALHFYNLTAKKLKKRIESGEIPAARMRGTDGKEWRIFPEGVPEGLRFIQRLRATQKKKKNHVKRAERIALEGEIISLRADVEQLEQRLTRAVDTISLLNYEMDTLKQVMGHVGISTTWLNQDVLEVQLDRRAGDTCSSTALISISTEAGTDGGKPQEEASNCDETSHCNAQANKISPARKRGLVGSFIGWLGRIL